MIRRNFIKSLPGFFGAMAIAVELSKNIQEPKALVNVMSNDINISIVPYIERVLNRTIGEEMNTVMAFGRSYQEYPAITS